MDPPVESVTQLIRQFFNHPWLTSQFCGTGKRKSQVVQIFNQLAHILEDNQDQPMVKKRRVTHCAETLESIMALSSQFRYKLYGFLGWKEVFTSISFVSSSFHLYLQADGISIFHPASSNRNHVLPMHYQHSLRHVSAPQMTVWYSYCMPLPDYSCSYPKAGCQLSSNVSNHLNIRSQASSQPSTQTVLLLSY